MLYTLRAWIELLKLGQSSLKMQRDEAMYMRGNIIRVLKSEGWFQYLHIPRTIEDFANNFRYTDLSLLKKVLDAMVEDNTLILKKNKLYQLKGKLDERWILPKIVSKGLNGVMQNYAKNLPASLRGERLDFSSGISLYDWDDALTDRLYEQMRKSAFGFTDALKRKGKFLDVGCGNGHGTTAIWGYYFQRNYFQNDKHVEITGMDIDAPLVKIASAEVSHRLKKRLNFSDTDFEKYSNHIPKFCTGSVADIPFEDNSFDMVYISQVLHWIDSRKAVHELVRVVKPGGLVFGAEFLFPHANRYNNFHFMVVKNATGCFTKNDLITWASEAGAKNIKIATPVSVFKFTK